MFKMLCSAPVFLKGDKNCRPVEHLCSNSIVVDEQFGFRKNLTTKKATYDLINGILCALSEKLFVGGIFCD
jgi:hypothetical protein